MIEKDTNKSTETSKEILADKEKKVTKSDSKDQGAESATSQQNKKDSMEVGKEKDNKKTSTKETVVENTKIVSEDTKQNDSKQIKTDSVDAGKEKQDPQKNNTVVANNSHKHIRKQFGRGGRNQRGRKKFERVKPEFDQKIIDIRRVTRVVAGGRRFSFSVSLVAGDRKSRVGVGIGKASDTALAIEKAVKNAKKNMVTLKLTDKHSIPHEIDTKYSSARLAIWPAPGKGLVAGSAARIVLELGGAKDVGAKIFSRSKNKLNIARATIKALQQL